METELKWVACPVCLEQLQLEPPSQVRCSGCGRIYAIRDGIPVLIASDGEAGREGR